MTELSENPRQLRCYLRHDIASHDPRNHPPFVCDSYMRATKEKSSYSPPDYLFIDMARSESYHLESRLGTQALQLFTIAVTKLVTKRCLSKAFAHPSGAIFFLNLCIKFGDSVTLAEANTLRFIAKHTSIPVPKVHCAFTHRGKTYILLEA